MLEHLKNISFSARNYFLKFIKCCPVRFVKKTSGYLFCQNKEDNNFFLHFNIYIIYLTHNGVQINIFNHGLCAKSVCKNYFLKILHKRKKNVCNCTAKFYKTKLLNDNFPRPTDNLSCLENCRFNPTRLQQCWAIANMIFYTPIYRACSDKNQLANSTARVFQVVWCIVLHSN